MKLNQLKKLYFIGIGGIGMSALARYFKGLGMEVSGYDKVRSKLCEELEAEGMDIHYQEDVEGIPKEVDLVVYTPAVPKNHQELVYYQNNDYEVMKRAAVLGLISKNKKTIAVAGTHGKTTTSAILTHVLRTSGIDCTAFLGGIAMNYQSNFVQGEAEWVVMEADEFDRSFMHLHPQIAILTSMDPDHLDIYGDHTEMQRTFQAFLGQVEEQIYYQHQLPVDKEKLVAQAYSYGTVSKANYNSKRIRAYAPNFVFDWEDTVNKELWDDVDFTLPGRHNVENATAAIAVAKLLGASEAKIRQALRTFKGIWRRFEWVYKSPKQVFIDDYAHHPSELRAAIRATRSLFPGRKITGVFQPHLYSRTRDFVEGFAEALDELDELLLLDIYPAREEPIEGVTSKIIIDKMKNPNKTLLTKNELIDQLKQQDVDVLLTLGAGDLGAMIGDIKAQVFGDD